MSHVSRSVAVIVGAIALMVAALSSDRIVVVAAIGVLLLVVVTTVASAFLRANRRINADLEALGRPQPRSEREFEQPAASEYGREAS